MVELDLYIPFNSIDRDRAHRAEGLAEMISSVLTDGVMPQPGNTFSVTSAGGWDINVAPGRCNIQGRLGVAYEAKTLTVGLPSAPLNRIDSVVLRMDPNFMRMISLDIKQGVPTSMPSPPTLQRDADAWELGICNITVSANAVSVTNGMLSDTRQLSARCGIINSLITVDPDTLFAQWEAIFLERYNEVNNQMTTGLVDFSMLLKNFTDQAEDQKVTFTNFVANALINTQETYSQMLAAIETAAQTALVNINNQYISFLEEADGFRTSFYNAYTVWFNQFQQDSQQTFNGWFQNLVTNLGDNDAVNIMGLLSFHMQSQIFSQNGAHGFRFFNNMLQAETPDGWVTIASSELILGLSWTYIESLDRTWQDWDTPNYTWEEFENLVELFQ